MRRLSVKLRLSLWEALLLSFLAVLFILFLTLISDRVSEQTAHDTLIAATRDNLSHIHKGKGRIPEIDDGFVYSHGGITTLIYSGNKSLMAGRVPLYFPNETEFINGEIRHVSGDEEEYIILDVYYPYSWEEGIWLRGVMEAPGRNLVLYNILRISMILLPLFAILSFVGSYIITRAAFRPMDKIMDTTENINQGRDLSRRLPETERYDEFGRLTDTVNAMFSRLEASFEGEKRFTSDASHELRTPVSIIKSACECSERYDETPEEFRSSIEMIHRQADHMSSLIGSLLDLTRLEQGSIKSGFNTLCLMETARLCCESFLLRDNSCDAQANYGISVIFSGKSTPAFINGDENLIMRLISNLISNGIKYGNPGGHVLVETGIRGEEAYVKVEDDGIGIAPDDIDKIWKRFFQVDESRGSSDHGLGLGLAYVDMIAALHDGRMELTSREKEGSCFTFLAPLIKKV